MKSSDRMTPVDGRNVSIGVWSNDMGNCTKGQEVKLESNDMRVLMWVRCGVTKKDNIRN